MPVWFWFALSGLAGGLLLAHLLDVLVGAVGRWVRGERIILTHFSPKGGCTAAVVNELAAARHEVLVQAYSFTCKDIAAALVAAVGRGVKVAVLLDRSNETETHTELGDLTGHGIDLLIDACHAIAHNKVMVIDGRTVLTGSFNFTNQAEHENAENLLVLRNHPELAAAYRRNFHAHHAHCQRPGQPAPHLARLRKAG